MKKKRSVSITLLAVLFCFAYFCRADENTHKTCSYFGIDITKIENSYCTAADTVKISFTVPMPADVTVYQGQKLITTCDANNAEPASFTINPKTLTPGQNTFTLQPTHKLIKPAEFSITLINPNDINHSHLKYFGYYHSNGFPPGEKTEYLDDIIALNHTNVAYIHFSNSEKYDLQELKRTLKKVKGTNVRLIISVWNVFFLYNPDTQKTKYASGLTTLQKDWQKRWADFKATIKGYEENIYAFYFDEPYWLGIAEDDFIMVTGDCIKKDYPNIGRMTCLSLMALYPPAWDYVGNPSISKNYIQLITDIAFDTYNPDWETHGRFGDYGRYMNMLKTIAPGKRYWIVPKVFTDSNHPTIDAVYDQYLNWLNLAILDKQVVGILNFSYCSGKPKGDWGKGAPEYFFDPEHELYSPKLKNLLDTTGKKITKKR